MEETKTGLRQHDWRQWTMTPVAPMGVLTDGSPAIVERGPSDTKVFCFVCMDGLNPDTMTTPCKGESDAEA